MKNIIWSVGVVLGLGGLLASCGTPQQRCIGAATRDMKVVERLMAESQGNLQRGYALENETVYRTEFQDCTPAPSATDPSPARQLCPVEVPSTTQRPVAIDLAAESAKLASLQAKHAQQSALATTAIAQCRVSFPK